MTKVDDPETEAPDPDQPRDLAMPEAAPESPAPPRAPWRLGIFGPILGGVLAAAGGFGLAHFDVFGLRPDPAPDLSAEVAALKDQLAGLSGTSVDLAALGQKITALEAADLATRQELEDRLAAVEALPAGDAATTTALAARLAKIETALQTLPATDTAALQADLDAALARLGQAEAEAAAKTAEASAATARINRDLALRALTEAVTAGQAFVAELQSLADPALDAALGPMASSGVPTLAALQAAFPDAARQSLNLARDISAEDGWSDRLLDFLAAQTEARSLTPRQGPDPDAILSRAEFALGEGRVADALTELAALAPAAATPLEVWTQDANRHLSAMTALAAAGGE